LIIVEPGGKQKANTGAQCNAGSSDENDLCEGKLPLYHFSTSLSFPAQQSAAEQVYSVSMVPTTECAPDPFVVGLSFVTGIPGLLG
jgi:hypothetical protein